MNENKNIFALGDLSYHKKNPLVIAELGASGNGDIVKTREMIAAASSSGADCVKFQMVLADEILHPNTGEVILPGGRIPLFERFKTLEAPPEFYGEIKEYAESLGLLFLCTPFGLKSASILLELKPKFIKIASPELNFTGLLEKIAASGLPTLLSTGVSTLGDIENAIEIVRGRGNLGIGDYPDTTPRPLSNWGFAGVSQICLLHCVTAYPAPETDYNLRVLPNLAGVFGTPVGVSDHSLDPEIIPSLAVSAGASVIEKHFCLSRKGEGLDDPIALEPRDFSKMTLAIRRAAEMEPEDTIREYAKEKGKELIERILGDGVKKLAQSEKENYATTNRSIHAARDIAQGSILKKGDYAVLRTEKNLRPGLDPRWEKALEGRTAKTFIPAGEGIRFEDI